MTDLQKKFLHLSLIDAAISHSLSQKVGLIDGGNKKIPVCLCLLDAPTASSRRHVALLPFMDRNGNSQSPTLRYKLIVGIYL